MTPAIRAGRIPLFPSLSAMAMKIVSEVEVASLNGLLRRPDEGGPVDKLRKCRGAHDSHEDRHAKRNDHPDGGDTAGGLKLAFLCGWP